MRITKMQILSLLTLSLASNSTAVADDLISMMEARAKELAPKLASACVSLRAESGRWGSGVLVSENGFVFTAAHTFSGKAGEEIRVFRNGKPMTEASLIKMDRKRDIAVLKIKNFSSDEFVTVSTAEVSSEGRPYLAAGHATGYDSSRVAPIRFGFGYRSEQTKEIMTTCRVNVGDSGGPLFDVDGKLVAVHRTMDAKGKYAAHVPVADFFTIWPELAQNDSIATDEGLVLVAQK